MIKGFRSIKRMHYKSLAFLNFLTSTGGGLTTPPLVKSLTGISKCPKILSVKSSIGFTSTRTSFSKWL